MSNEKNNEKFIYRKIRVVPASHFWYLSILVLIAAILVIVLSIRFGDSPRAGEDLNFAATVSSIILAVIAIIITIVDGANQKENNRQLSDSVEALTENIEEINKFVSETEVLVNSAKLQFDDAKEYNKELLNTISNIQSSQNKILDTLKSKATSDGQLTINEVETIFSQYSNNLERIRRRASPKIFNDAYEFISEAVGSKVIFRIAKGEDIREKLTNVNFMQTPDGFYLATFNFDNNKFYAANNLTDIHWSFEVDTSKQMFNYTVIFFNQDEVDCIIEFSLHISKMTNLTRNKNEHEL